MRTNIISSSRITAVHREADSQVFSKSTLSLLIATCFIACAMPASASEEKDTPPVLSPKFDIEGPVNFYDDGMRIKVGNAYAQEHLTANLSMKSDVTAGRVIFSPSEKFNLNSKFVLNNNDLTLAFQDNTNGIELFQTFPKASGTTEALIDGSDGKTAATTATLSIKGQQTQFTYPTYGIVSFNSGATSSTKLGLVNLDLIEISDHQFGILAGVGKASPDQNIFIDNVNKLTLTASADKKMQRGIMGSGAKTHVSIHTNELISADLKGWSICGSCQGSANEISGSKIVTGNGTISLESKVIDLKGNTASATDDKLKEVYAKSWGINAMAEPTAETPCGTQQYIQNADSTISVTASEALSLNTNWGGVSAESSHEYFAKVNLQGANVAITSAGATSKYEAGKGYDNVSAGIRAVSFNAGNKPFEDNKEASVTINGGTVSLAYNKDGDLNKAEKQHDMIYAKGSSAKVVVNASDSLAINAKKHDVRNLAYADEGGWIELNTGTGATAQNFKAGKMVANGNLTARNGGKIDAVLAAGSTLEGAAFDNSFVTYSSAAGGYAHATNAGEVKLAGEGGALWTVKQYEARGVDFDGIQPTVSTIKTLTANESSTHANPFVVDLTKEKAVQKLNVGTLGGTGSAQFNLRLNVNDDGTVAGNDRVLFEKVSGEHGLFVTVDKHNIVVPEKLNANWLAMVHTPEQGKFVLANEGGVDIGGFKYTLANEINTSVVGGDQKSQYWYLERTNEHSDAGATAIEIAGNQRFLHWADLQDLRKRLGEVRYGAQDGAWARVTAQKDKADGAQGTEGMEQEYYGVNVGFDRLVNPSEERTWLVGGSFTYGQADQDTRRTNAGSGETDRYGFNLYATWAHANGSYADFVFSGDWYDQNVTTRANGVEQKGSYDTWGAGLSVEIGHMFSSERSDMSWGPWYRHFWIEPQLQLAYYRLNGTDYQLSNNGIRVNLDDDDSLIGRAGVVLGSRWNYGSNYNSIDQRYVQVQLKGGVKHDFLGDYSLTMNDLEVTKDIGATTFYYGVGADWQLSDNARVYVNVERESGDDYTKEYEANIGVKFNFN